MGDLLLFVWCMLTLALKTELERTKSKLSKIASIKRRGTIVHSRARWYEHGEQNSRYFCNLEKRNQKKKHITSLVNNDSEKISNPKDILEEVDICIFERSNKKSNFSRKVKYIFTKKLHHNYKNILGYKYESRRENEFWATCHNTSNLFDGCWHPLFCPRKNLRY